MKVTELNSFDDGVVVHFGCEEHRVKTETFVQSIESLAGTANLIGLHIDPQIKLEFYIEAIGPGSLRAKLRYAKNNKAIQQLAIGLLSGLIVWQLTSDDALQIEYDEQAYIIKYGDDLIKLPREAGEYYQNIRKDPKVVGSISRTFKALESDDQMIRLVLLD